MSWPARLGFLLWAGFVSFSIPEVFAGTGAGWPVRPDVYILGIPVYALHLLVLCDLAVRTGRVSWTALYLFGVVFGLYETWITKVVWNGYPGSGGFAMGGIGPWFGLHETVGLVLFFHPVVSFLIPVAVLSRLFPGFGRHFPPPDWLFGSTWMGRATRIGLVILLGLVTGHNMPDPAVFAFTWAATILVLSFGFWLLDRVGVTAGDDRAARVATPRLGGIARWVLLGWLLAIYAVTYAVLLPERLPPLWVQAVTAAFYPLLAVLIWRSAPSIPAPAERPRVSQMGLPALLLGAAVALGAMTMLAMNVAPGIANAATQVAFVAMLPAGALLFGLALFRVLRPQRA